MHAASTNQIADILYVNDNMIYNMKIWAAHIFEILYNKR